MSDKNNPAFSRPDFAVNEEQLAAEFNNLCIKKNVNVKWSDNIIDNENFNHNTKIHNRKKTPIKRKNRHNNNNNNQ